MFYDVNVDVLMVLGVLIYLHITPLSFQQLSHYKLFPLSRFSFFLIEFFNLFEVSDPVLDSRLQGWVRVAVLVQVEAVVGLRAHTERIFQLQRKLIDFPNQPSRPVD